MNPLFKARSVDEAERAKQVERAKAIIALEESEGWKHLKAVAEELINSYTPDISSFTTEQATTIASQIAFTSGIKRILGIVNQQREILASLKKPGD
jgi:hypothetical protein